MQSLDKADNGKLKVTLKSHHVASVLELCKVCSAELSLPMFVFDNDKLMILTCGYGQVEVKKYKQPSNIIGHR